MADWWIGDEFADPDSGNFKYVLVWSGQSIRHQKRWKQSFSKIESQESTGPTTVETTFSHHFIHFQPVEWISLWRTVRPLSFPSLQTNPWPLHWFTLIWWFQLVLQDFLFSTYLALGWAAVQYLKWLGRWRVSTVWKRCRISFTVRINKSTTVRAN